MPGERNTDTSAKATATCRRGQTRRGRTPGSASRSTGSSSMRPDSPSRSAPWPTVPARPPGGHEGTRVEAVIDADKSFTAPSTRLTCSTSNLIGAAPATTRDRRQETRDRADRTYRRSRAFASGSGSFCGPCKTGGYVGDRLLGRMRGGDAWQPPGQVARSRLASLALAGNSSAEWPGIPRYGCQ